MSEPEVKSIFIHSNGTFSCFDANGKQMGKVQNKGWMELFFEYLEEKGIDPTKVQNIETIVSGRTYLVRPTKTEDGWSWGFTDF